MKKTKNILIILLVLIFSSCQKNWEGFTDESALNVNNFANDELFSVMKDQYYWNTKMPSVNPSDFKDPFTLMEALKYKALDRWSFVDYAYAYDQLFEEGKYVGYGVMFIGNFDNKVYIAFVFKNSQLYAQGVRRGWKIVKIDGVNTDITNFERLIVGDAHTFTFQDLNYNLKDITISTSTITMNTVLYDTVFDLGTKKVGYLVLESFISSTEIELKETFSKFNSQNITDVIIDFRYNGGGYVSTAISMAASFKETFTRNQLFGSIVYNEKNSYKNQRIPFEYPIGDLNVDRAFFITTQNTASASELVINSLKPYLNVQLIGTPTHGKPVGMEPVYHDVFIYVPITFTIKNAAGEGSYFNGLSVNKLAIDDVSRDFGDTLETSLRETLFYIKNGRYTPDTKSINIKKTSQLGGLRGVQSEFGIY